VIDEDTATPAALPDASTSVIVAFPAPTLVTVKLPDDDDGCTVATAVFELTAVKFPV
jgi:hypothetical protein